MSYAVVAMFVVGAMMLAVLAVLIWGSKQSIIERMEFNAVPKDVLRITVEAGNRYVRVDTRRVSDLDKVDLWSLSDSVSSAVSNKLLRNSGSLTYEQTYGATPDAMEDA